MLGLGEGMHSTMNASFIVSGLLTIAGTPRASVRQPE
jgi:hypothetical protein